MQPPRRSFSISGDLGRAFATHCKGGFDPQGVCDTQDLLNIVIEAEMRMSKGLLEAFGDSIKEKKQQVGKSRGEGCDDQHGKGSHGVAGFMG